MAGVEESSRWSEDVYRLEETDFMAGGAGGVSNLPHKHLASRTLYLKAAGAQTVVMRDDEADPHHMVYIPRFRVPADVIAQGVPSQDLLLGGFLVDKYHSSLLEFVGGTFKAASIPLRLPATNMAIAYMKTYAGRRKFGGRACRLMSLREWGHLAWLIRLLNHDLRGNLQNGRDPRDADKWQHYGEPGYGDVPQGEPGSDTPSFGGSGPLSWFHTGLASGIADLLGNVWHVLEAEVVVGCLKVVHPALLVDALLQGDQDFQIEDPRAYHDPHDAFARWPETNGLVAIGSGGTLEFVSYGQLVPDPQVAWKATLTNCVRGLFGTADQNHDAGVPCDNQMRHCLIPQGYAAVIDGNGLNNVDDPATFNFEWGILEFGTHDAVPAEGDLLCCQNEDLLVQSVVGNQITVARGQNGTQPAPHVDGMFFTKYSPTMERVDQGRQAGYAIGVLRNHVDLEELYLPATTQLQAPTGPRQMFQIEHHLSSAGSPVARGGCYKIDDETNLLELAIQAAGDLPSPLAGFRCTSAVADHQYGGT